MLFNPFKHQFETLYLRDETDSSGQEVAILKLRNGSEEAEIQFPKKFLPPELQIGNSTALVLQPQENLQKTEAEVLRNLLEELVK